MSMQRHSMSSATEVGGGRVSGTKFGDRLGTQMRETIATCRSYPELALIAMLLLLTAIFSRSFSKGVSIGPVYVTEVVMLASAATAVVRLGLRGSWEALRRLPLIPLALIWLVGVIATVRGLRDFGLSAITDDVGLFDYTLLLPLLALVVVDRRRHEALFTVLVACGFAGIATFCVAYSADQLANRSDTLITLQGSAAGLYMSLAVAWIAARLVNGVPTSRWLIALLPIGLVLMGLTTQRSVWMIAILALGAVVVAAPSGVRMRAALATAAVLVVGFAAAAGVQAGVNTTLGGVEGSDVNFASGSGGSSAPQLTKELGSSLGGGDSAEADNVTWRIAYWKELISRTPDSPLTGVGFGRPAAFTWDGRKYDFRDGDPGTGIDVAGPHNSFVNFLYRMGIPAFLAFVFVIGVALLNVWRALRNDDLEVNDRVAVTTLLAMLAAGTMASAFNEGLTGPFLGLFFWVPLGMLLLWPAARGAQAPSRAFAASTSSPTAPPDSPA